ncbi:MAG: hypothetical protein HKN04_00335 [Rhodothermaceae bacterium]|nr:hypothetical protein [Rhodothermaceae bacterium]
MPDVEIHPAPTSVELKQRLETTGRSIEARMDALHHELTTVADITVAGRPILDHVRERPLYFAGLSLAGGLVMGLLSGTRARAKRRPEMDEHTEVLRLYTAYLLDEAADRVARGKRTDEAIGRTLKRRPPLISYEPPPPPRRSTLGETFDVAVKTAMGFGVKMALDRLGQRLTGEEEITEAVKEADPKP